MKILFLVLTFFSVASAEEPLPFTRVWKNNSWMKAAAQLPIQSAGRVKPLDTFAREGIALLVGKEKFKGKESVEILLSLVFEPQVWHEIEFLQINYKPLKTSLELDPNKIYFSTSELMKRPRLMGLFGELQSKLNNKEKLDPYFQAVQRIGNQLSFVQEVISAKSLRFVPPPIGATTDAWLGFDEYSDEIKLRFALMAASFTSTDENIKNKFPDYIAKFSETAQKVNPGKYPSPGEMAREVQFNFLRPFQMAWILGLVAILFLVTSVISPWTPWGWAGLSFLAASFGFQVYGFAMRCWIAGRPPVSNMYESVIWVAFGCMVFGIILEAIYRKRVIAIGALVFSTIALIIADNVSSIMDGGIHPLEPVLRSNFWLMIHVLTITLGYAAFALSMILGNIGIGQIVVLGRESKDYPFRLMAFYAYRATQIGVILLAAGTILGGVWADYSWGRFWGWDPKETWALIALLGYLALLHARFSGMVGPFGFLCGCVIAFLGVLMAWYGVNFVLGAGLHSYGFSSGGVTYVATYCSVQILFVAYAQWLRRTPKKG